MGYLPVVAEISKKWGFKSPYGEFDEDEYPPAYKRQNLYVGEENEVDSGCIKENPFTFDEETQF